MDCFLNKISLVKNKRGVWDLDTTKGCYNGMLYNKNGCYGDCYAARYSKRYGYKFTQTIERKFETLKHLELIRDKIMNIDMPFIRIGVSGDPSESWAHTISAIKLIHGCYKQVVIITKHWNILSNSQIKVLSKFDVCINTSISALDNQPLIKHRLSQYNRLKGHCKSVLRVVSCDFNIKNLTGMFFNEIQNKLFKYVPIIDNILRVSRNNPFVIMGIINIDRIRFIDGWAYVSIKNKDTYIGICKYCPDMCGINN